MKVWAPQPLLKYALVGKFPHTLVNQLLTERKIEAAAVSLKGYEYGYRVLSSFYLESNELVLNVNDDFIITGE